MKKINKLLSGKVAEIQISYSSKVPVEDRIKVTSSRTAYQVFIDNWSHDTIDLQEEFKILLLNCANDVLGIYQVSKGGISGTIVDVRLILATALKCGASSIIMAHNHPSGNTTPSQPDIDLTHKIVAGGKLVDVLVLDHLIVTSDGYLSMADEDIIK